MLGPHAEPLQLPDVAEARDLAATTERTAAVIVLALMSEPAATRLDGALAARIEDAVRTVWHLGGAEAVDALPHAVAEDLVDRALWETYRGRFAPGRKRWRSLIEIVQSVAPEAADGAVWALRSGLGDRDS